MFHLKKALSASPVIILGRLGESWAVYILLKRNNLSAVAFELQWHCNGSDTKSGIAGKKPRDRVKLIIYNWNY